MPINKTNADGGNGYGLPEYTLPNGYKMGASGQGVDMNTGLPINKTKGGGACIPDVKFELDKSAKITSSVSDSLCSNKTELSEEQLEVRKMGAGYELVFWKDSSKSLRKGNSTWGNLVRGISHLTNEIERLNKAISEAKKERDLEIYKELRKHINNQGFTKTVTWYTVKNLFLRKTNNEKSIK